MVYRKLKIVMRNTKPSKMIYRKLRIVMRNTKPSKMIYRKLKIVMNLLTIGPVTMPYLYLCID
jgi:hypothetical protein